MDCLKKESTIRNCLGGVSFVSGLICFACGSTYNKVFGKLGSVGLIAYLGISSSIFYLIWGFKRISVSKSFQLAVETLLCVAICLISVELDKMVPGSDALSIISYALFALMSGSTSRKSELGFETGFFTFFLSLFSEQLFKADWKLFPIALGFCLAALLLRHRSPSDSGNGDRPQEVLDFDVESQYSSEQSLLPHRDQQSDNEEEQVSEENISDGGNEQNNEQEEDSTSSLAAESSQDHISSANYQNGYVHSHPSPQLRRRRRMTRAIQNISSSLGDTLRQATTPLSVLGFFFSFF